MEEKDKDLLKEIVIKELDACGYFMSDIVSSFERPANWKPYSSKSFGEMLMDFACLYNMEFENKNYSYKLEEEITS